MEELDPTPLAGRFSYTLVCLICLSLVSSCFTLRTQHLSLDSIRRLPAIRLYLIFIYFWGICFIIAVASLQFGYQVWSPRACFASIILCLIFYVVDKVIIYFFLVERIHVVRSRRYTRLTDHWYIANIAIVILGFGSIAILSFIFPVAEFSDRKCHIGLPFKITLPLLIYDITINLYLTSHFLYFVRPGMTGDIVAHVRSVFSKNLTDEDTAPRRSVRMETRRQHHLRKLARRTLNGMCVMLLATTVNLVILFYMSGHEEEWMCFMFCTLDVTVGILALHYVTNHPAEKHLGVKELPAGRRHSNAFDACRGAECETSVYSAQTRVWASDWDSDDTIITAPDRIFVSTSFELYRIDEHPSEPES